MATSASEVTDVNRLAAAQVTRYTLLQFLLSQLSTLTIARLTFHCETIYYIAVVRVFHARTSGHISPVLTLCYSETCLQWSPTGPVLVATIPVDRWQVISYGIETGSSDHHRQIPLY